MKIPWIGTLTKLRAFKGVQTQQQTVTRPKMYGPSYYEMQKIIGKWDVSLKITDGRTRNFTISNRELSSRECYCINGYALEHNPSNYGEGHTTGCYLNKEEKELVDSYIDIFKLDGLREEDIDDFHRVLEYALERHGESILYY